MALLTEAVAKTLFPKLERPVMKTGAVKAVETVARHELAPGTRLAATARKLLTEVHETAYSHVPEFDVAHGILKCDCSELINYIIKQVDPKALDHLPHDAGHPWTRAHNFEEFFADLPMVGKASPRPWRKIEKASHLAPGDVVAWKNTAYVPGKNSTGHVMMVVDKPRPVHVEGILKGFDVPIVDATSHGHGLGDLRSAGRNGLGPGTIFIPTDAHGLPTGFQWESSQTPNPSAIRPNTLSFGRLMALTTKTA